MSTNPTKMTVALLAVAAFTLGCKKERPSTEGAAHRDLPVPSKLPPARPQQPAQTPQPPAQGTHSASIDNSYATVLAMYNAPEGATPCESAYNVVAAEQAAAKTMKRESIFKFVAAKDVFFTLCQALPAASQHCLVPRYEARNHEACQSAKAPAEQVNKLFVIRKDLDQPAEPVPAVP